MLRVLPSSQRIIATHLPQLQLQRCCRSFSAATAASAPTTFPRQSHDRATTAAASFSSSSLFLLKPLSQQLARRSLHLTSASNSNSSSPSSASNRDCQYDFTGRTALIIGGAGDIGSSIAELLYRSGARICITSRTKEKAMKVCKRIESDVATTASASSSSTATSSTVASLHHVECDVRDSSSIKCAISEAHRLLSPRIDILIYAAGVAQDQLIARATDDAIAEQIETNLIGAIMAARAVSRVMLSSRTSSASPSSSTTTAASSSSSSSPSLSSASTIPSSSALSSFGGRIIFIGSVVGESGNVGQSVYSASKAGLHGLTRSLSKELASRSITVNCVNPGYCDTNMTKTFTEEQRRAILSRIPLQQRMGNVSEIAHTVAFICTRASNYTTGQIITIDGGLML